MRGLPDDVGHLDRFGDQAQACKSIGHALLVGHGGGAQRPHRRGRAALQEEADHAGVQAAEFGNQFDGLWALGLHEAVGPGQVLQQGLQGGRVFGDEGARGAV